jgi:hypothetical protein
MKLKLVFLTVVMVLLGSIAALGQAFGPPSGGGGVAASLVCNLLGGADCAMTGQIRGATGSAGTPSFGFASDTGNNTGIFRVAEDNLGISTNGTERVRVSTTAMSNQAATGSFNIAFAAGTSSAPTYAFAGDTITGLYRAAAGIAGLAGPNGHVLAPGAARVIGATDTTTQPLSGACRMSAAAVSVWTPSETGAIDGQYVCCTNTGTNTITMTESSGVYEGPATASVVGQFDTVCFEYVTDRWVQKSFQDN